MIPQALTSSIMSGGGLGMAEQFAQEFDPSLLRRRDRRARVRRRDSTVRRPLDAGSRQGSDARSLVAEPHVDAVLTRDVLCAPGAQLESARRMLAIVLEQAAAIRQRASAADRAARHSLQSEMHRREVIEAERLQLLERAGVQLGVSASDVSITMLAELMDEDVGRGYAATAQPSCAECCSRSSASTRPTAR